MARVCANTKPKTSAVNTLGAADGFRPKAIMLAKELAANTMHGPMIQAPKMSVNAIFLDILIFLYNDNNFIESHFDKTFSNFNFRTVNNEPPSKEPSYEAFVMRQYFHYPLFPGTDHAFGFTSKNHFFGIQDRYVEFNHKCPSSKIPPFWSHHHLQEMLRYVIHLMLHEKGGLDAAR